MTESSGKSTIYVDVDDEITALIDKVKSSPGKIVALVLPKRATVLQSIVNMKLLKKASTDAKKNLVLITTESGLMPLAGKVGLHVADTPKSKPVVPPPPDKDDQSPGSVMADDKNDDPELDKSRSVGELAGTAENEDSETIALDNAVDGDVKVSKTKVKSKFTGLKIPNFDRFRLRLLLAVLGVFILIGGWLFATLVLPKAVIVIKTDTQTINTNLTFTANSGASELKLDESVVPAVKKESKQSDTEKFTATGQKDNGEKAKGTITAFNCTDNSVSVPAGTAFSSGSLTYLSDAAVTVPASNFTSGGSCKKDHSASIAVTASNGGTSYNIDSGHSFSSNFSSTLTGSGSAMTGGTTNIITVVSRSDVDEAVAKTKGRQDDSAKTDLQTQLSNDGLTGLFSTLTSSEPEVKSSIEVGQPAEGEVTVTVNYVYSVVGVKASDLSELVKKTVNAQIDTTKQSILDDGVSSANLTLKNKKSDTESEMNLETRAVVGPELNIDSLKAEIKGMKKGDAISALQAHTGVTDVTVSFSPFWVYKIPGSTKKIVINIEKTETTTNANEGSSRNGDNP